MMMLAEMYGMMPRAKIERFSSAPPENRLNSPSKPPWPDTMCPHHAAIDTGVVMNTPAAVDRDHRST